MNRGHVFAFAAYFMWGILPIYWQRLHAIPATQIVSHRILWSCLVLVPIVIAFGQGKALFQAISDPKVLSRQTIAAVLILLNWLGFVWAVSNERMIESSLGYFINPLISVLLGMAILGEKIRPVQAAALLIATLGVLWLTLTYGSIPWIAILLATTFCLYGYVKKTTSLHPISSLTIETWVLALPALIYLLWEHRSGRGGFLHHGWSSDAMLVLSGIVTSAPLLCFAAGAQRIPLATIGLLQYVGPTLQFALGTLVYHEPFDSKKFVGFILVWIALAIYATDSLIAHRKRQEAQRASE